MCYIRYIIGGCKKKYENQFGHGFRDSSKNV